MGGSYFQIFHQTFLQRSTVKLSFHIVIQPHPPDPAKHFGLQYKMKSFTRIEVGDDSIATTQQSYSLDACDCMRTRKHTRH